MGIDIKIHYKFENLALKLCNTYFEWWSCTLIAKLVAYKARYVDRILKCAPQHMTKCKTRWGEWELSASRGRGKARVGEAAHEAGALALSVRRKKHVAFFPTIFNI